MQLLPVDFVYVDHHNPFGPRCGPLLLLLQRAHELQPLLLDSAQLLAQLLRRVVFLGRTLFGLLFEGYAKFFQQHFGVSRLMSVDGHDYLQAV